MVEYTESASNGRQGRFTRLGDNEIELAMRGVAPVTSHNQHSTPHRLTAHCCTGAQGGSPIDSTNYKIM